MNTKRHKHKTLEAIQLTNYSIVNIDEYILCDYLVDDEDIAENGTAEHTNICRYQVLIPIRDIKKLYDVVKDL